VRLDERRPSRVQSFDEVRDKLLQEMRARYVSEQRDARIQAIHRDPALVVNQKAVDALVVPYDPAAAKRGATVPVPGGDAAPSAVPGNAEPSAPPASAAK
jgi:hypothetical protein